MKPLNTLRFLLSVKYVVNWNPVAAPRCHMVDFLRRAKALKEIRDTNPTVFHLDAGETLLKGFFSNKETSAKDRALLIGELSIDVGVDVWTVGPSDLMAVGMKTLHSHDWSI